MRNIYSATNWLSEVVEMGLPSDKYTAVRLRSFYQAGVGKGMSHEDALSYAKERLKINLEKNKGGVSGRPNKGGVSGSEDELLDSFIPTSNKHLKALLMKNL